MIPFNKPYLSGNETYYIKQAVESGKISGNGIFTKKCHNYFQERYGFKKCLLTTSCTDALEMAAILLNIMPGDEVIMPSYTFVSTANAFVLRGAKIIFVDSRPDHPGINEDLIEELITPRTKVIVPVHYAGVACDMDKIMDIAQKHKLYVVEDAAQSIDSFFKRKPLGSIGHFGCFSFHETKNIQCGEGGMLVINDDNFNKRAEIIWEKGTDRAAFFRGEIDKYGWVDIGSSFLPSELTSAFLFAQLENLEKIQLRRKEIWTKYYSGLKDLADKDFIKLPQIPEYATNNAHIFYLNCKNEVQKSELISYLKTNDVLSVFHYISLHKSKYYKDKNDGRILQNADRYSDTLIRLPLYYEIGNEEMAFIIELIKDYFDKRSL